MDDLALTSMPQILFNCSVHARGRSFCEGFWLVPRVPLSELCSMPLLFLHFVLFFAYSHRSSALVAKSDCFASYLLLLALLFQPHRHPRFTTTACPCGELNTIPNFPVTPGIFFFFGSQCYACLQSPCLIFTMHRRFHFTTNACPCSEQYIRFPIFQSL